jgi:(R)-2-hydroxyacyl-CoA dehydratese activating ATPase
MSRERDRTSLYLGIDIGSIDGKAVALSSEGEVVGRLSAPAIEGIAGIADRLQREVGGEFSGGSSLWGVVATGRGRFRVGATTRKVNEVLCQARGVRRLVPSARALLDIGGRDAKLILLGPGGEVEDFLVQADCVTGMRRLMELVGAALDRDPRDLVGLSGDDGYRLEIDAASSVCADHQVVSLLASGEPHGDIWAGIQRALAARLAALFESLPDRARLQPLVVTGGIAHYSGVLDELSRRCGTRVSVAPDPAFTAALGAAMIAWASAKHGRRWPNQRGDALSSRKDASVAARCFARPPRPAGSLNMDSGSRPAGKAR